MKHPKLEENIAAMKELLHWYETGEDEPKECPLCDVNEGCQVCPWKLLTAGTCEETAEDKFDLDMVDLREYRDPEFLATRIPQLKEWIEVYEKELGS